MRVFLLHHVTWSINSVCHFFGRRRFETEDKSTNVWWLALPSFGEAWHHNHHAFPRSATHGLGRLELDPSAAVIWSMEKLGLVWDVVRITPERQTQRMARAGRAAPPRASRASRGDAGGLVVLALAEATLLVLLGILLGKLLLALAEAAVVLLLGIDVGQVLLALAEAPDLLVLGEDLG